MLLLDVVEIYAKMKDITLVSEGILLKLKVRDVPIVGVPVFVIVRGVLAIIFPGIRE